MTDDESTLTALRDRAPRALPAPPVGGVVARGRALRARRRRGLAAAGALGVAAVAVAAVGVAGIQRPDHRIAAATAPGTVAPGALVFTVTEDAAAESPEVRCVLTVHFAAGAVPATSSQPCTDDYAAQDAALRASLARGDHPFVGAGEDPTLAPVASRDDRITVGGHRSYAVTGTAPAGTVAVVATDTRGRQLTATLVRPAFTSLVVWGFDTTGRKLTGVQYVLPGGRHSTEEELSLG